MSVTFFAVFARAIGFFVRAPGLSHAATPAAVRALFAFGIAAALAPALGRTRAPDAASFIVLIVGEVLAGAVFGLFATLIAEAVAAAGRMLDDLAGIRASIPGLAIAPAGYGGLWALVFTTAFFALGGIEAIVAAFAHSFEVVPLGASMQPQFLRHAGPVFAAAFMRISLELATPGICVVLCIHLGSAALTRALSRLSQLSIAFPLAYAGVLLAAFTSLALLRELAAHPMLSLW